MCATYDRDKTKQKNTRTDRARCECKMRYVKKKKKKSEMARPVRVRVGQRIISRRNYYGETPLPRKLLARTLYIARKKISSSPLVQLCFPTKINFNKSFFPLVRSISSSKILLKHQPFCNMLHTCIFI